MINRYFKLGALTLAVVSALAFAAAGQAEAGSRHRDRAIIAGAVGVTAGVLLGAALAQPSYAAPVYAEPEPYYEPDVVYVEPRPHYRERVRVIERHHVYESPAPRYRRYEEPVYREVYNDYAPEPWTPDWYSYCASKYRSFDVNTGTFQPYNGPRQVCR